MLDEVTLRIVGVTNRSGGQKYEKVQLNKNDYDGNVGGNRCGDFASPKNRRNVSNGSFNQHYCSCFSWTFGCVSGGANDRCP